MKQERKRRINKGIHCTSLDLHFNFKLYFTILFYLPLLYINSVPLWNEVGYIEMGKK